MVYELKCAEAGMDCPFEIRSENDDELVEFVQEHAKTVHDAEYSTSDVRDLMRTI